MGRRKAPLLFTIGGVLAVVGTATTIVYVFQPWRTCPYDDTPSACAMLPLDATIMSIAMLAAVAGVALVIAGIVAALAEKERAT